MPPGTVNFIDHAIPLFGRAMMWVLLAPLILRLRTKIPLAQGWWIGGIGVHFAMSFVVMGPTTSGACSPREFFYGESYSDFWTNAFGIF